MKKIIVLSLVLLAIGCGTPTPGPTPNPTPTPVPIPIPTPTPIPVPPVVTFEVLGKKIAIKAQMKVNPKVSLEEMRAAVRATVAQLEGVATSEIEVVTIEK